MLSKTKTTSAPDGLLMQGDCTAVDKKCKHGERHMIVTPKACFHVSLFYPHPLKREKKFLSTAVEPGY